VEIHKQLPGLLGDKTDEQHDRTIHLASRLLCMIKFGDIEHECLGGRTVDWNQGSLQGFLHDHFTPAPVLGHEQIKLEKSFTAASLGLIAGVEVEWVDSLSDHLRLVRDDTAICIFHHTAFLRVQRDKFVLQSLSALPLVHPCTQRDAASY
jgi:hypothetical protein